MNCKAERNEGYGAGLLLGRLYWEGFKQECFCKVSAQPACAHACALGRLLKQEEVFSWSC